MRFEKGSKVQAVDELGRWEEVRIVKKDGDQFEICFVGRGSRFNRLVEQSEVRELVDPFDATIQTGKPLVLSISSQSIISITIITRSTNFILSQLVEASLKSRFGHKCAQRTAEFASLRIETQ